MASLQAHLTDLLFRVQIKRRLAGITDLATARAVLQGASMPAPKGASFEPTTVGGVAGEWVRAESGPDAPTLLYLHGGGYFACSPQTHRPITAAYAKLGFAVFVPDYRLAPEHKFPAALEDAEAVWNGLLQLGHTARSLSLSGESAGGGLSLALLLSLRDKGLPMPASAALFSPWTDLACTGRSTTSNLKRDAMFWAPGLKEAAGFYVSEAERTAPLASPLYAELAGLPPLLIHVGERELLRDDSTRLADKAREAGVEVHLRVWPVVPHAWQIVQFIPEARQSIRAAADFLHRHAVSDAVQKA